MDYLSKQDLNFVLGKPLKGRTKFILVIILVIIIFALLITFLIITGYLKLSDPVTPTTSTTG